MSFRSAVIKAAKAYVHSWTAAFYAGVGHRMRASEHLVHLHVTHTPAVLDGATLCISAAQRALQ